MTSTITVSIVLHDSAEDLAACLASVAGQSRPPDDVVVLDNASADDGVAMVQRLLPAARLVRSERNLGFAAGQNRAMAERPADIHVLVNPDARLAVHYLEGVEPILDADDRVGAVAGRLLRFRNDDPDGDRIDEYPDDVIDSTGMVALRNRRVLDRSAGCPAAGTDVEPGYVFGATGAVAAYRRTMLDDVALDGDVFDPTFFAYREDVDLAWRAQLRGWRCRYEPGLLARHRRRVTPERRSELPAWINRRSVANRWRMLLRNETAAGWRRDWPAILGRDAAIIGWCLVREWSSLPAILDVARDLGRLRDQRRSVARRRRASHEEVLAWFGRRVIEPLDPGPTGAGEPTAVLTTDRG
jgi:GT2 family glycosyltransferase